MLKSGFGYLIFLITAALVSILIISMSSGLLRQREICRMDKDSLQAYYMAIGGAEYYLQESPQLPVQKYFETCGFKIQEIKGRIMVEGFSGNAEKNDSVRRFQIKGDKLKSWVD